MVTLTRMPRPGRPTPASGRIGHRAFLSRTTSLTAWTALACYLAAVVSLTCLKAWFTIGDLWYPENQRTRELRLEPFGIIGDASTTFGAAFDILGNVLLFVPLGVMLTVVTGRLRPAVAVAASLSVGIETTQYVFSLGRTDITDVICNVAGAVMGAAVSALVMRGPVGLRRGWTLGASAVTLGLTAGVAVMAVV